MLCRLAILSAAKLGHLRVSLFGVLQGDLTKMTTLCFSVCVSICLIEIEDRRCRWCGQAPLPDPEFSTPNHPNGHGWPESGLGEHLLQQVVWSCDNQFYLPKVSHAWIDVDDVDG